VEVVCLNADGDEQRRQVLTIERRELALHREGWYQKRRRHETGKLITPEGTTVGEKMAVRCLSIRPLQAQSRKEGSRQRQSQP